MARYIDAELIEYERHEKRGLGIDYGIDEKSYYEVAYKEDIDKIPTADVKAITHGHWIQPDQPISQILNIPIDAECKNCGAFGNSGMDYCYRCGAEMGVGQ